MASPKVSVLLTLADQLTQPLQGVKGRFSQFSTFMGGVAKSVVAGFSAIAIGNFFKAAIEESIEAEQRLSRLKTAVNNVGGSFEDIAPRVDGAIKAVQKLSTATDDDLTEALTRMITISGDANGALDNLQLAADLAAFSGVGLAEAGDLVGKAMIGQTKGLKSFGISTKDSGEALDQLRAKVTGFAEQDAASLGGRLKQMSNGWGDFKEAIGRAITNTGAIGESVGGLSGVLSGLAGWIDKNAESFGGFIGGVMNLAQQIGGLIVTALEPMVAILGFSLPKIVDLARVTLGAVTWVVAGAINGVKTAVGVIYETIGSALVTGTGLLQKMGIDVGDGLATSIRDAGVRWQDEAAQGMAKATTEVKLAGGRIVGWFGDTEKKATDTVKSGGANRKQLTADQLKALEDQRKTSAKALEGLEAVAHKAELDLLNEQHRQYLGAVGEFEDKMKDMTATDRATAETLLQTHLGNLLQKWAGFDASMDQRIPKIVDSFEYITLQGSAMDDLRGKLERYNKVNEMVPGKEYAATAARQASWQGTLDVAEAYDTAALALGGMLDAIGASTPRTDAFVASIGSIKDALGQIATGDTLGAVTSGLAGIASFAKVAFTGQSASAKAVAEGLAKTREKLEEHKRTLGDLISISAPGRQLAGVESALGGIDFSMFSRKEAARGVNDKALQQMLGKELVGRGMTMADLDDVAKTFGQEIRDDKGRLNVDLLQRLFDLLANTETGFSNTFGGQRERIQGNKDVGVGDELTGLVDLIKDPKVGIPAIAAALDSAGGDPAAQVAALQSLFAKLGTPGAISKGDLGGASEAEFRQAIKDLIGLITDSTDTTTTATTPAETTQVVTDAVTAVVPAIVSGGDVISLLDSVTKGNMYLARIAADTAAMALSTGAEGSRESLNLQTLTARATSATVERLDRVIGLLERGDRAPRANGDAGSGSDFRDTLDRAIISSLREAQSALGSAVRN